MKISSSTLGDKLIEIIFNSFIFIKAKEPLTLYCTQMTADVSLKEDGVSDTHSAQVEFACGSSSYITTGSAALIYLSRSAS